MKPVFVILVCISVLTAIALFARIFPFGGDTNRDDAIDGAEPAPETISDNREIFTFPKTGERTILVVYFHGNIRCPTCLAIERMARETVTAEFGDLLAAGTMQWSAVNYDVPENEPLARELRIELPSLVVIEASGGRVRRCSDFPDTWDLIHDAPALADYIRAGIAAFLEIEAETSDADCAKIPE